MASSTLPVLRRALLYVPASSSKMLAKSLSISTDNVTYDLEDSVTPHLKADARSALRSHLITLPEKTHCAGEIAVRINGFSTRHAEDDIKAVASLPVVETLVIPKVHSASDLVLAEDMIRQAAPQRSQGRPLKLLALIESAKAVMDLRAICGATPNLKGLIFAAEDFALDMSLKRTSSLSEFLYARSAVATAARAFELESTIDLVTTAYEGNEALGKLELEAQNGKALGFNGKQCIHPSQVGVVQQVFVPSTRELDWAMRVVVGNEKAEAEGRGAWTLDGDMVDAPVVGKARAIVARAQMCGIDVHSLEKNRRARDLEQQ